MKKLLFIDACVRGEKSRTKELCDTYIHCYAAANPVPKQALGVTELQRAAKT